MIYRYSLRGRGNLTEWRDAARGFLAAGILPNIIEWRTMDDADGLFGFDDNRLPPPDPGYVPLNVPASFVKLAGAVLCHSDPTRFALLYRMLFRILHGRHLMQIASDPDVVAASRMAKSVGRDYHKMTAFVRFKELPLPDGAVGRRLGLGGGRKRQRRGEQGGEKQGAVQHRKSPARESSSISRRGNGIIWQADT